MYNEIMKKQAAITELLKILKKFSPELSEQYHVRSLGIFGSFVRDEQTGDSDLDILVSFNSTPSLFTYIQLEDYLSEILDVKVDLVMEDALKPKIGERILNEVVRV